MGKHRTLRLNRVRIERLCSEKGLAVEDLILRLGLERRTAQKALKGEPVYARTGKMVADALGVGVEYLSATDVPSDSADILRVFLGVRPINLQEGAGGVPALGRHPKYVDGFRFLLTLTNTSPEQLVIDELGFQCIRLPAIGIGAGATYQEGYYPSQLQVAHVVCLELTEDGWAGRWPRLERQASARWQETICCDLFESEGAGPLALPIEAGRREVITGSVLASAPGEYRASFTLRWLFADGPGEWSSPELQIVRTGLGSSVWN